MARREPWSEPPMPPPFRCVVCGASAQDDRWAVLRGDIQKPPVCKICQHNWSSSHRWNGSSPLSRPSGMTRGDYATLQRLTAINNRLIWETYNGRP
jgi:hypothetical protein